MAKHETGRLAGFLYLVVVITGIFSLGYVPSQLAGSTDPKTIAQSILASEALFRAGIAGFMVNQVAFVLLPLTLYKLLRSVNQTSASVMVAFALVSVPIALVAISKRLDALSLLTDASHAATSVPEQLQAQALVALGEYRNAMFVVKLFWGLWLLPLGYLIFNSGFLPKILGVLLMLACASYMIDVFGKLLVPAYASSGASKFVMKPASVAEIGTCLWLLFVGCRRPMHSAAQ